MKQENEDETATAGALISVVIGAIGVGIAIYLLM